VLRGDAQVDRRRIIQFRMSSIPSTTARSIDVRGLTLSKTAPETDYEYAPYVDELGQYKAREWQGKTQDVQELVSFLQTEREKAMEASRDDEDKYGSYGGWKGLKFEATGYFRTERDGQNWWFVDPEGYALFSSGMDCVGPSASMHVAGMEHLIPSLPDKTGLYRDAWSREGKEFSFQIANLITAFGEEWRSDWRLITESRLKRWGFNTIGNWSDPVFIRDAQLPYVYPMTDFPATEYTIFRDFPDVFSPEYEQNAERFARQLLARNDDRRMIGYFMRNEPHWAFVDSLNLTEKMMNSPVRSASKERFVDWLREMYGTVARLNTAWDSTYCSFEQLYEPEIRSGNTESPMRAADYAAFNRQMIRRYVEIPAKLCKQFAPNHLNLGMRYAWVGSDEVLEGCEWFDVFSLNCYQFSPDREEIIRISEKLNRPIMIGEYHFGAADSGMLAYGIRAVATQEERALAYRYYVEQAAAIPELIGVHYFQWNDQPVLGRFDGENYQIGVVDVCNRPYESFIQGVEKAHDQLYDVRTGRVKPYDRHPDEIPKTGF
jgi:Beta-galactosidase